MQIQKSKLQRSPKKIALAAVACLLLTAVGAEAATGVFSSAIRSVTVTTESGSFESEDYVAVQKGDSIEVTVPIPEGAESAMVTVDATGGSEQSPLKINMVQGENDDKH